MDTLFIQECSAENRKQVLRAYRNDDGKTVYGLMVHLEVIDLRLNDESKRARSDYTNVYDERHIGDDRSCKM